MGDFTDNPILAETRYGTMRCPRGDRYITRSLVEYGEFSPGEVRLFRELVQPGHVVVEAGANVGALTLCFAEASGQLGKYVHAFEPQPGIVDLLERNCSSSKFGGSIKIHRKALGAAHGRASLRQEGFAGQRDINRDGETNTGGVSTVLDAGGDVEVVPLDHFHFPNGLHFLKIDVEGNEASVVRGACETIRKHHPHIYFEADRPGVAEECIDLLRAHGYKCFLLHTPPLFDEQNWKGNQEDVFAPLHEGRRIVSVNILALKPDFHFLQVGLDEFGLKPLIVNGERVEEESIPEDLRQSEQDAVQQQAQDIPVIAGGETHSPESLYEAAQQAIAAGDDASADKLFGALFDRGWGNYPQALQVYANHLASRGRYEECLQVCLRHLALFPRSAGSLMQAGACYGWMGDQKQAGHYLNAAVTANPTLPSARWNRALWFLRRGELGAGWSDYEWGRAHGVRPVRTIYPEWRPQTKTPGGSGSAYVWAEQGIGDTLMMLRFVPFLRAAGRFHRVVVEVPPSLVPLVQENAGRLQIDRVVCAPEEGGFAEATNAHISLMSLPGALGIDRIESIPGDPYLFVPASQNPHDGPRPLVGVCWKGNPSHTNDRYRSLHDPETTLAPLCAVVRAAGGATLSLLPGESFDGCDKQWGAAGGSIDFLATAQVVQQCDLVVTVDTAVAHLAGALGKRTILLVPKNADWRWMLKEDGKTPREDSPWYPSFTVLTQDTLGEWAPLVERAISEIQRSSVTD